MNTNATKSLALASALIALLGSGCASVAPRNGTPPLPRTQLVLLNIGEASGWVAFDCADAATGGATEDYRIVVINEKTGTVIYESRVPLAADLCSHGFEMAANDPRLIRMARGVDRDIITPIEGPRQSPAAGFLPPSSVAPAVPAETAAQTAAKPHNATDAFELPELAVVDATPTSLVLDQGQARALKMGQRFFIRTEPKIISNPVTGEELMVSKGQVSGLLEITKLEGARAVATLLSGQIPEAGYLELAE